MSYFCPQHYLCFDLRRNEVNVQGDKGGGANRVFRYFQSIMITVFNGYRAKENPLKLAETRLENRTSRFNLYINMLCISIYKICCQYSFRKYVVHIHLGYMLSIFIYKICCAYPFMKYVVHIHL